VNRETKQNSSARGWIYIAIALGVVGIWLALSFEPTDPDPRPIGGVSEIASLNERNDLNVLFILIDTLRADRLGSYGYERDTTDHIDALAADGILFKDHIAQSSWTKTSMASLWTSLYPARTGILRYTHAIPDEARLPAEILSDAGFRTIALWRNGWVAPNFGFQQGFDAYTKPAPRPISARMRAENPAGEVAGSDADILESAREALRTIGDGERFFLYVHMMDLHQYMSDEESARFGTSYSDFYDNALHWTDRLVGALVDALTEQGFRENTIIVLASDHGEAFREHGTEGHARNVYQETVRTPLIINFPFRLAAPAVVDRPTQNVDVWPTILDLMELPGFAASDGRSLRPEIEAATRGETLDPVLPPEPITRFSHLDGSWGQPDLDPVPIVGMARGNYRAIAFDDRPVQIYDVETDRGELRDLATEMPEVADEFAAEIDLYLEDADIPWATRNVELDDLMLNQLRALGYKVE
jgi:arylsulfatase A-like enzyme